MEHLINLDPEMLQAPLMKVDQTTGWLEGARRVVSPNCDERLPGIVIDLLVVHGISLPPGEFGGRGIEALFTNTLDATAHPYFEEIKDLRVSAHVVIRRSGEIVQYVPFQQRAWHAGQSCFDGREQCNDFSIGIELEGCDDQPYTDAQYRGLTETARAIMVAYPAISVQRIVGHCDIAPGRKTDPGPAFVWQHFHDLLGQD